MKESYFSQPITCAQQVFSDLISFTFSIQLNQKVHFEHEHKHIPTHKHILSHTHRHSCKKVPLTGLKDITLITMPMLSTVVTFINHITVFSSACSLNGVGGHFNTTKQLTRVCVCECCHELQVLLHECGLVHHSGTGGRHKGHGGTWGRRSFRSDPRLLLSARCHAPRSRGI